MEQNEQSDFLSEKIKVKPVNKRKLIRRTIITATMAVIFGLIACVTFLILEPIIKNWIYPEEEPPIVMFPEDPEEMAPEDMLAESPTPAPAQTPEPTPEQEGVVLEEEQIQEILSEVKLDLDNYKELYSSLSEYVNNISRYMVTVTTVTTNVDWFSNVQENKNQCSGVIIYNTGIELLILTNYSPIKSAERLLLTFHDNTIVEAQLKARNLETDLAVLSVELDVLDMPEEQIAEEFPVVNFGYYSTRNYIGMPVVAIGNPMGVSDSVGYGMITASSVTLSMTDRNYSLLMTDIIGSQNANGMLFNLQGQMIGVITGSKADSSMKNVITAYGITELQRIVEKMSNASEIPYMGIKGVDVTREANQGYGVPYGAYVEEIDMDSPAMRAGIQRGDVIVSIDDSTFTTFRGYSNALIQMEPGQTVNVTVKRQAQDEYKEMSFTIELGEVK